jgi:hypothetical protein
MTTPFQITGPGFYKTRDGGTTWLPFWKEEG